MTELDIYRRVDGKFAWRLKAANGEVIATDGGQGYENLAECRSMARRVVTGAFIPDEIHEVESASRWGNKRQGTETFECAHGDKPEPAA